MTVPVVRTKKALGKLVGAWRAKGLSIGFVPTMGALHPGHAALVEKAARENDKVIVSVFVTPPVRAERGLRCYPRARPPTGSSWPPWSRCRLRALRGRNVSLASHSRGRGASDLYCGKHRPGHFRGSDRGPEAVQSSPRRPGLLRREGLAAGRYLRIRSGFDVNVALVRVPIVRRKTASPVEPQRLSVARRAARPRPVLRLGGRAPGRGGVTRRDGRRRRAPCPPHRPQGPVRRRLGGAGRRRHGTHATE